VITIRRYERGVTLLEVILVLAIGAGILFLSLSQYQVFRQDADAQQLKANVDILFQAMSQYYKANCYGTYNAYDPNTTAPYNALVPGTLNPMNATNPLPGPYYIDIQKDLIAGGYLPPNFTLPMTPLVNTSGASAANPYSGYVLQFNASVTMTRNPGPGNVGSVLIWQPQVAVLLQNTTQASAYLNYLQGDCLSQLKGKIVTPCASSSTGTYVVWARLPSYAETRSNSTLWQSKAVSNQFQQLYNTYPTVYLLETVGTIPKTATTTQIQYYLCGG
jgi:type II secretory pathway pseudopilin PulG